MLMGGGKLQDADLEKAIASELRYIRRLGVSPETILATSNLGAYEAVLMIIAESNRGMPVYRALQGVSSRYSSQSGIIKRLKTMREAGLIYERPGEKKSQVYLCASESLVGELRVALLERHAAALRDGTIRD